MESCFQKVSQRRTDARVMLAITMSSLHNMFPKDVENALGIMFLQHLLTVGGREGGGEAVCSVAMLYFKGRVKSGPQEGVLQPGIVQVGLARTETKNEGQCDSSVHSVSIYWGASCQSLCWVLGRQQ